MENSNTIQRIFTQDKQHVAGFFYPDSKIFRKKVSLDKHTLRYPQPSLAIDECALDEAYSMGGEWLEFFDPSAKVVYKTPIETMRLAGGVIDYGFGRQRAMPIRCMVREVNYG